MSIAGTANLRNPLLIKLLWWSAGAAVLVSLYWVGGIVDRGLRLVIRTVGLHVGNETIAAVLLLVAYMAGLFLLGALAKSFNEKRRPLRSLLSDLLLFVFLIYMIPFFAYLIFAVVSYEGVVCESGLGRYCE